MEACEGADELVDVTGARGDLEIPLWQLAQAFGETWQTLPAKTPYLSVRPQEVENWRRKLRESRCKVGLAWQGHPQHGGDYRRSIRLTDTCCGIDTETRVVTSGEQALNGGLGDALCPQQRSQPTMPIQGYGRRNLSRGNPAVCAVP